MTKNLVSQFHRLEEQITTHFQAQRDAENALKKKNSALLDNNRALVAAYDALSERLKNISTRLASEHNRLLQASRHDGLTGLPGRAGFHNYLKEAATTARNDRTSFALISINLRDFNAINTTFGHVVGDGVLKIIAARLARAMAATGYVARVGGDEFAVIVNGIADTQTAEDEAERILSLIRAPITYKERTLRIGASIAVVTCPQQADNVHDLQRFADLALHRAKASTGERVIAFSPTMMQAHTLRKSMGRYMHSAMLDAIDQGKIRMLFQPVIDLTDYRPAGLEALMRWHHREHGWIAPLDVLAIANDTGLLPILTRHIFEKSIREARASLHSGQIRWLALNLTASDLHDPELGDFLLDCLKRYAVDPRHIKLEITEHTVIGDTQGAKRVMTRLAEHGIRFAIDDFGTGYSNLLILNRLPFHSLKIDRSFITDIARNNHVSTIVKAMINLAHALKLSVIAEGIEDRGQFDIARSLGCEYGQGFLFGRPQPLAHLQKTNLFRRAASHVLDRDKPARRSA